jgi:hypothetical protein
VKKICVKCLQNKTCEYRDTPHIQLPRNLIEVCLNHGQPIIERKDNHGKLQS